MLDNMLKRVSQVERQIEREIGEARSLVTRVRESQQKVADLEDRAEALEEAIGVLNSFADRKQEEVKAKIEGLVTQGLQTIFSDQDLRFVIVQEQKARRMETRFVIVDDHGLETSIMDARGGGVAAVAGFLLRLIVTLLQPNRHFLMLDESFAHVSEKYESALVEFVRELVDRTSIQIVLTTHKGVEEWIAAADKAYRFTLENGRTTVQDVSQADT